MKKQHKSGSGVLVLGTLALAAVGGFVVYRQQTGGELPAWAPVAGPQFGNAPTPAPTTGTPAPSAPIGVDASRHYGGSFTDRYARLWGGGTVVQGGGGGTLTPTLSTDASSTRGGATTGQPVRFGVNAGRYY